MKILMTHIQTGKQKFYLDGYCFLADENAHKICEVLNKTNEEFYLIFRSSVVHNDYKIISEENCCCVANSTDDCGCGIGQCKMGLIF